MSGRFDKAPSAQHWTAAQAELYALTHRGSPGDRELYAGACEGAGSVLELGCGYGRLLRTLARASSEVVGLECDTNLRALARRAQRELPTSLAKRVSVVSGDMRRFDLKRRFERVLIPHSGIYCLLDRAGVLACLACVREHLAPGGCLTFDAYAADSFHADCAPGDHDSQELDPVVSIDFRGRAWDVYEKSSWHKRSQRLDVTYVYRPRPGGEARELLIAQRYLLVPQLLELLKRAGLETTSLGDMNGRRWTRRSEAWVIQARAR